MKLITETTEMEEEVKDYFPFIERYSLKQATLRLVKLSIFNLSQAEDLLEWAKEFANNTTTQGFYIDLSELAKFELYERCTVYNLTPYKSVMREYFNILSTQIPENFQSLEDWINHIQPRIVVDRADYVILRPE